jgi:predicted permease
MGATLSQTMPFFALVALGYGAGRTGFLGAEANAALTRFVFYFALPALLFGFASSLSLSELWDPIFVAAYLSASLAVWALVLVVAAVRRLPPAVAAMEAQCAVVGNVGFLGIPMLAVLLGEGAVGPVLLVLATDLIVFGSLIVIAVTARGGAAGLLPRVAGGLLSNPLIVSIGLGLAWAAAGPPVPGPVVDTLRILGGAATPGALFAIGASLAALRAERFAAPAWLSAAKLVLHPAAVAVAARQFGVEPYAASVMIAAAALPVAGNVYILAAHYGVAPGRVSASILISTAASVATVTLVVALLGAADPGGPTIPEAP